MPTTLFPRWPAAEFARARPHTIIAVASTAGVAGLTLAACTTGTLPANVPVTETSVSDAPQPIAGLARDTMGFVVGKSAAVLAAAESE